MNGISLIVKLGEKVLNGEDISREEAESLGKIGEEDVVFLLSMADKIRSRFMYNC